MNFNYKWGARSPSDSNLTPMGFATREAAQHHCDVMNAAIEFYDEDPSGLIPWNKDYWKTKPEQWVVVEMP